MRYPVNRNCPLTGEPSQRVIAYISARLVAGSNPTYRENYAEILGISPDDEFPFVQSTSGFVYSGYLPSADFLCKLYEDVIDHSRTQTTSISYRQKLLEFAGCFMYLVAEINDISPLRLLDFGCGYGALLSLLASRDIIGYGFEPSIQRRNSVTADGHFPIISNLDDLAAAGPFNLLICTEVLEHVPDPRGTLRILKSVAAPGALLALTVPQCELSDVNHAFDDLDIHGRLSAVFNPWEHLQYFTASNIRQLLSEEGFIIVDDFGASSGVRAAATRIGRQQGRITGITESLRVAKRAYRPALTTQLFCRSL